MRSFPSGTEFGGVGQRTVRRVDGDNPVRVALLPWHVAGWRTQYDNLVSVTPPAGVVLETIPIVPYKSGGLIERLPLLRSSHKGTLRLAEQMLPLLTAPAYDAILAHAPVLPMLPLVAAQEARLKTRSPIVYAADSTPTQQDVWSEIYFGRPAPSNAKRALRDRLYNYALSKSAAVVTWSQWGARSFRDDHGVSDERLHVIPPGVDLTRWVVPRRRCTGEEGTGRDSFRLLFVGADFERKGGPLLLDVFREGLKGQCELHLVTKAGVDEEDGVRVYREFHSNDRGLRDLYERCDALVLPTRADTFSLASLEAMACGLPVISCPVGGIPEIVSHGETGLLIPPDDGRALREAIVTLMRDTTRISAMGLAGRKRVEERFDNVRSCAALFDLLSAVARGGF